MADPNGMALRMPCFRRFRRQFCRSIPPWHASTGARVDTGEERGDIAVLEELAAGDHSLTIGITAASRGQEGGALVDLGAALPRLCAALSKFVLARLRGLFVGLVLFLLVLGVGGDGSGEGCQSRHAQRQKGSAAGKLDRGAAG